MRLLRQAVVNALLWADADSVCGAQYGQASPERRAQRNGYRHRDLDTRVGQRVALKHGSALRDAYPSFRTQIGCGRRGGSAS